MYSLTFQFLLRIGMKLQTFMVDTFQTRGNEINVIDPALSAKSRNHTLLLKNKKKKEISTIILLYQYFFIIAENEWFKKNARFILQPFCFFFF